MTTELPDTLQAVTLTPIARIRSCYTERFGIPRQAGLVKSATACIVFENSESSRLSLRGLDEFSHLWVIFLFHKQHYKNTKPLVSPPRLGGKKRVGVFATRSPNRPNPVGMSAVRLESIQETRSEIRVNISEADLLDQTPVLDVKPYIPFADCIENAQPGWAESNEGPLKVVWTKEAQHSLDDLGDACVSHFQNISPSSLKLLIEETIAQDPRPAYERIKDGTPGQCWGMKISDVNVRWQVINGVAEIVQLDSASES